MLGSSGAIVIVGLIRCGQRCDLVCVMNVFAVIDRGIVHMPCILRSAVGGIIVINIISSITFSHAGRPVAARTCPKTLWFNIVPPFSAAYHAKNVVGGVRGGLRKLLWR